VLPFEILYNEVLQRVPDEVGADAAFSPAFVAALRRGAACGVRERADYFGGSRLSVAVHVRRGDVTSSRHTYMRLPDTYYLELIRTVRALVPDAAVHVFSSTEGNYKPSDFDAYTAAGASVHLDGDPTVAWSHFMRARVLILSKGTFSSIAAYFNTRGCVIHPPTDSMVRRDEQRLLSRWLEPDETLEVQLRECLRDQAGAAGVDDGAFEFAAQDGDETAKGPPEYSPSSE